MDALGLAETTPGSLDHGDSVRRLSRRLEPSGQLPPLLAATVAALVTRGTTFTPCFLWIFFGRPLHEKIARQLSLDHNPIRCHRGGRRRGARSGRGVRPAPPLEMGYCALEWPTGGWGFG